MRGLRALWLRLRGMFLAERADGDFAAELESHVAMDIEDGVLDLGLAEKRRGGLRLSNGAAWSRQRSRIVNAAGCHRLRRWPEMWRMECAYCARIPDSP